MAKLYFYYSSMNAGKSTVLLQSAHNYKERGMETLLLIPAIDTRAGGGRIRSRIGIEADATRFGADEDLLAITRAEVARRSIACVLLDEAQFLTDAQVGQLTDVCDQLGIPVLAYGIRTDFQGNLFQGSARLLAWADNLIEIKTVCHCGRKATMILRVDPDGKPIRTGAQIEIGDTDRYVSVCRKHFKEGRPYA